MSHVALMGLGAMGVRMAGRLLEAGHTLTLYNRSAARAKPLVALGATLAASPADAVKNADIAIAIVRDDEASHTVWLGENGALAALPAHCVAVESSTVTPQHMEALASAFAAKGRALLDAPVIGSLPAVEAGKLLQLVGGDAQALEKAKPVLAAYSAHVHHVGTPGDGARFKLVANGAFLAQAAIWSQLLGALAKSGIAPEVAVPILNQFPMTSPAMQGLLGLVKDKNYTPFFPIELVIKDLGYLRDFGAAVGAPLPGIEATLQDFKQASNEGCAEEGIAAISKHYLAA